LILNIIPEAKSQGQGGIEKSKSGPRRDRRRTSFLLNVEKFFSGFFGFSDKIIL